MRKGPFYKAFAESVPTDSHRFVCIAFREYTIGRDRYELILAVPRKFERRLSVALDPRHVARHVMRICAAGPRGETVRALYHKTAGVCHGGESAVPSATPTGSPTTELGVD